QLSQANDGNHRLDARVEDLDGYIGSDVEDYRRRWPGYVRSMHEVSVRALEHTRFTNPNGASSASFIITNEGSRPAEYDLTVACSKGSSCPAAAPSLTLDTAASGRVDTVTVGYQVGSAAGDTATITLVATHPDHPAATDTARTDVMITTTPPARSAGVV